MRTHQNDNTNGMRLALLVYLCTFCAVFGAFISTLHAVLGPTVLPNPGLSAYKAPAGTSLYPQRLPPEPEVQVAMEEPASPAPPAQAAAPEKARPAAKPARQKTAARNAQRTAERIARQRYERGIAMGYTTMGYAAPEGSFRPWF